MTLPSLPALYVQAQLEIAVGGAKNLRQLVDKNNTGDLASASCQAFLSEVSDFSSSEVYSLVAKGFDPMDPDVQAAKLVRQCAVTFGVYWTWHKSTGGTKIPPDVREARDDARKTITETSQSRSLGDAGSTAGQMMGAATVKVANIPGSFSRRKMGSFC